MLIERIRAAVSIAGVQPSNPPSWMVRMFGGRGSSSGIPITEYNALTVSDVYKCVRVLGETVAMLPWKMFKHVNEGTREATEHPLYPIMRAEPNDHMTSFDYRFAMIACLNLWGKHHSYVERNPVTGKIVALWPLAPDRVRCERRDGDIWWYVRTQDGPETQFFDDEILYIPFITIDGFNSISPIRLHAEALGLAKALEVNAATFFGNNSQPGGFLSTEKSLKKEAKERLKEAWEKLHRGVDNAHRVAVLEEGMKWNPMSVPPDVAQFIESRKFQRTDVNGLMRVPPHKTGDLERGTFSNIEQQNIEFYSDGIIPLVERIEQGCNRRLLLPSEKKKYFNQMVLKGVLRGDTAARTQYYKDMFDRGIYSGNKILELEGENPVPGLDRRFVAMNMVPLDLVDSVFKPDKTPAEPDTVDAMAPVRMACKRFFRDATGRVLNRKPADRQKYAESAFLQPVLAVFECILGNIPSDYETKKAALEKKLALMQRDSEDLGLPHAQVEGLKTQIENLTRQQSSKISALNAQAEHIARDFAAGSPTWPNEEADSITSDLLDEAIKRIRAGN
jgi:HK97 family phage portal protein